MNSNARIEDPHLSVLSRETVQFVKRKHIKVKQSPSKQLAALNVYFESTGLG